MSLIFSSTYLIHIIFTIVGLLVFTYFYFKYRYTYWARKNVEHITPKFPFGNVSEFILKQKPIGVLYQEIYNHFKTKNLSFGGFYSIGQPTLMICDLDLIKSVTTKEFKHFHDKDHYSDEENDPLTVNLFALKGIRWRNLRTKLTPTFTSGKMKMMYQFIMQCSDNLTKVVGDCITKEESIDIKEFFARYAIDVIGNCAFGIDCNSLSNPQAEFRIYGKKFFEGSYRSFFIRMLLATNEKFVRLFKLTLINPDVTKFFLNLVKEIIEYREKNKVERKDVMNLLIKLKNNESIEDEDNKKEKRTTIDDKGLSFAELSAQVFIFFSAGFETSSSTMSFCFYELARNQDIQNKLRDDILETLKNYNNKLTFESIMEMSYLDKVIKETLRKYPIGPALTRKCTKQFKIPDTNIVIEEGTGIVIPILGIHRNPEYYPDPIMFDPERFNENQKAQRHQYSYMPFGEGPRVCIGKQFALLQIKVGIASLIQNYRFTLDSKSSSKELKLDNKSVLLNTQDAIWLKGIKL